MLAYAISRWETPPDVDDEDLDLEVDEEGSDYEMDTMPIPDIA